MFCALVDYFITKFLTVVLWPFYSCGIAVVSKFVGSIGASVDQ